MTKAQLAILPIRDGRKADRRIVNLAARLRDPGARLVDVDVLNLSTDGFMARGAAQIEVGTYVWLRVTGLDVLLEKLRGAGIAVITKPEWDDPQVGRFARIHDPEGNAIELWEPAAA